MSKDSRARSLDDYRASIHSVVKPCAYCTTPFETKFGMYCSPLCKSRAHRAKEKAERIKDLICFYCGTAVKDDRKTKFCCEDHKNKYHKAKDRGKPLQIRIDAKTVVYTKKYDSVPEVIRQYKELHKLIC